MGTTTEETDQKQILWADDEIELLRSHIIFLKGRGYDVAPVTNGDDAIAAVKKQAPDVVLLDEMMPGKDGLTTLQAIKDINPHIPVIMITKNEEERVMEQALGHRIDDYLTKPVNPSQILLACKKLLDARQLMKDRMGQDYVVASNRLQEQVSTATSWQDWIDIHVRCSEWDLQLDQFHDPGLMRTHGDLRRSCNREFGKFVEQHYERWIQDEEDSPLLSVDIVNEFVAPPLLEGRQVFFVVVDCMRLDHWMAIQPLLSEHFNIQLQYHY